MSADLREYLAHVDVGVRAARKLLCVLNQELSWVDFGPNFDIGAA